MRFATKSILSVLLLIAIIVFAFIFLLRGCLSKFDERSAHAGILYFKHGEQEVIFSIVKSEKTTSYSSQRGMTHKTVSTTYHVQSNDAVTLQKLASKKIIHHSDVKNYPVEVLGGDGKYAWVFMNELIAFDPITLERIAGLPELENKTPVLKSKFPAERRFYVFDRTTRTIRFTAKDGSRWIIDSDKLIVKPDTGEVNEGFAFSPIETQIARNQRDQDTLYEQKVRTPIRLRSAGQISRAEFDRMNGEFTKERNRLFGERDSLRQLHRRLENARRQREETARKIASLAEAHHFQFNQLRSNADTSNGQWFGLYAPKEIEKLHNRFNRDAAYDETARRQFYKAPFRFDQNAEMIISLENASPVDASSFFLDGGFLLDKTTAFPIRFGKSYLAVHKSEIGAAGTILVSRVDTTGRIGWTFDSGLKTWSNYIFTGNRLILLGTMSPELSSGDCDILRSVDLQNGKATAYDFFEDR